MTLNLYSDVIDLHEGEARRLADRVFTVAATPRGHCKAVLDLSAIATMREHVGRMRRGMAEFDPSDHEAPITFEAAIVDAFIGRMRELLVSARQRGTA